MPFLVVLCRWWSQPKGVVTIGLRPCRWVSLLRSYRLLRSNSVLGGNRGIGSSKEEEHRQPSRWVGSEPLVASSPICRTRRIQVEETFIRTLFRIIRGLSSEATCCPTSRTCAKHLKISSSLSGITRPMTSSLRGVHTTITALETSYKILPLL